MKKEVKRRSTPHKELQAKRTVLITLKLQAPSNTVRLPAPALGQSRGACPAVDEILAREDTNDLDPAVTKKRGRLEPVFNKEQERELADYLKDMESGFYGLTSIDLRKLAYDLAERNNLYHNFDHDTKMAGRCWLEFFLKRNLDLSFRKPEATSAARAASPENPVLLLLDGRASHVKNLDGEITVFMSCHFRLTARTVCNPWTPKIIMPFPKTTATKRKSVRRGKTAVITSSPYRKELDVTRQRKQEKERKKESQPRN
ncbi:Tigger transposable element-derived protein 1 [Danaus plexippus plexippus]|uniref:Tigger transposable element-derived protein 1 n=1 Tax=Danaus plexippus plexippus TaxID=278856 RepID=A0A212F1P5_DANPL|nr:Tigger transposable element-derived protein 1 [Danaus plexippus plexippus]